MKINEGDFCSCGYVKTRSDKYIEENDNLTQISYKYSGTNYKKIVLVFVIIIGLIIGGKYILSRDHGIEGTYISYSKAMNHQEVIRLVLKDGEYIEYLYKQPMSTGAYEYDKSTNTLILEGWSTPLHYGTDIDGYKSLYRQNNNGTYEYYYKK